MEITIQKEITDSWIWRKSDHFKWWVDLLFLANEHGEIKESYRSLASRWRVSTKSVINFLSHLEADNLIAKETQKETLLVTPNVNRGKHLIICNFDSYKDLGNTVTKKVETLRETQKETPKESLPFPHTPISSKEKRERIIRDINITHNPKESPKRTLSASEFVALWNEGCGHAVKCKKLTQSRAEKISMRVAEFGKTQDEQREMLLKVLSMIRSSSFLQGENGWKADIDWLVANDKNWLRIIEGKYENKKKQDISKNVNDKWNRDA